MKRIALALALSTLAFAIHAQHAHHAPAAPAVAPSAAAKDFADGEVRKLDAAGGRVTLRHGEIRSIGMAPMTMVFRVKDPAMLGKLAVGDKVRFQVQEQSGDYVVTAIEKAS